MNQKLLEVSIHAMFDAIAESPRTFTDALAADAGKYLELILADFGVERLNVLDQFKKRVINSRIEEESRRR